MTRKKIAFIFGTRPEALKLIPILFALKANARFAANVCVTGQHREMLDQVLSVFNIRPDFDLNLMEPDQSLTSFTAKAMIKLDRYLRIAKPDLILVQGDTTSAFIAALAGYYNHIPVGHVEAGLRTKNKYSPFPEEINRALISQLADLHFAPTPWAKQNLLCEGIDHKKIHLTGNTIVDMLQIALKKATWNYQGETRVFKSRVFNTNKKIVLITGHRRESFGEGFKEICLGIIKLADRFPDINFVYPMHLNPRVRVPVRRLLSNKTNIFLLSPLDYLSFITLMKRCSIILTDSGGIQEEAPSLGKPVLIMRKVTERPEAVKAGTAKLVGAKSDTIFQEASKLLVNQKAYQRMAKKRNPFGDGKAAKRIVGVCERYLTK